MICAGKASGEMMKPHAWNKVCMIVVLVTFPCPAGVLLSAPFVTAGTLLASRTELSLYADVASVPGMISGAIWNVGNICSVIAVRDPGVGLAIAYPIMQCGLFVAGLWGIILFAELKVCPVYHVAQGIKRANPVEDLHRW
jgi:glucose uptake protein GlcU